MDPRPILPYSIYLLSRRCTQRQFWLKPSQLTNQIVMYCVGVAANRYNIKIHAICVMSNHWHAVVSDPEARLPQFLQWTHEYIAKCINASYGRWENMWAIEPTSVVRLEGDEDVLDKLAYCLANPVAAGLVAHGEDWPGVRTSPEDIAGAEFEVMRPRVFLREDGPMPASSALRIERPAICTDLSDVELAERVDQLVSQREATVRETFRRSRRRILGAEAILEQRPEDSPTTIEARRGLSPQVAAKNKRLRMEALRRLKSFIANHRVALRAWRSGQRDVEFPAGTYAMRVVHSATVGRSTSGSASMPAETAPKQILVRVRSSRCGLPCAC